MELFFLLTLSQYQLLHDFCMQLCKYK